MTVFILLIKFIITAKLIFAQNNLNGECNVVNYLLRKNNTNNCCLEDGIICSKGHIIKM